MICRDQSHLVRGRVRVRLRARARVRARVGGRADVVEHEYEGVAGLVLC